MRPKKKLLYQSKRKIFLLEKQVVDLLKNNNKLEKLNINLVEENKKQKVNIQKLNEQNTKSFGAKKILKNLLFLARSREKELKRKLIENKYLNDRYIRAQKILLKALSTLKEDQKNQFHIVEELRATEEELRQSNEELYVQKDLLDRKNTKLEFLNQKYIRGEKILIKAYNDLKTKEKILEEKNKELSSNEEELLQISFTLNEQKRILEQTLNELKDTQLKLIQTEKNSSVSTMAVGFAHEINNPLNFIYGGATGLENYLEDIDEELKNKIFPFLNAIKIGVKRTTEIIKIINKFKVYDKQNFEECSINNIIQNSLKILHNTLNKKINIVKNFNEEEIIVFAEQSQLYQLFFNVLQNAEQAIENKGEIIITTKMDDKNAIIIIEDNGIGIDHETLMKIMDPFYTTKEPGKGYGLGLFLSNSIVKQYNGNLSLSSEKDLYTKVSIKIPKNFKKDE